MVDLCLLGLQWHSKQYPALQLSGRAALEAAMEKKTAKQASLHSKQTIGAGLGRETQRVGCMN